MMINGTTVRTTAAEPRAEVLLSASEAAIYIGVPLTRFIDLVEDGRMASYHTISDNGRKLWRPRDLDRYSHWGKVVH